jgi:hypothetical protein
VLELSPASAAIVVCLGPADALDALPPSEGAFAFRVAPDELMLVSLHGPVDSHAVALLLAPAGGLVVEQSDAYAAWTLAGAADDAFARLSAIELPRTRPAFVQGVVAGIPAKAIVEADRIHVLVSSALGHHLRERVEEACSDRVTGAVP